MLVRGSFDAPPRIRDVRHRPVRIRGIRTAAVPRTPVKEEDFARSKERSDHVRAAWPRRHVRTRRERRWAIGFTQWHEWNKDVDQPDASLGIWVPHLTRCSWLAQDEAHRVYSHLVILTRLLSFPKEPAGSEHRPHEWIDGGKQCTPRR